MGGFFCVCFLEGSEDNEWCASVVCQVVHPSTAVSARGTGGPRGRQVLAGTAILQVRLPGASPAGRLAELVRITGQALSGEVQADSAFVEPFLGGLFTLASGGLH